MTPNNKQQRSRDEVVRLAFIAMYHSGDLTRTEVCVPLATGGILEKTIYKVRPNEKRYDWERHLPKPLHPDLKP